MCKLISAFAVFLLLLPVFCFQALAQIDESIEDAPVHEPVSGQELHSQDEQVSRSQERKASRTRYRGLIPAPGDGVLGGYEDGGSKSPDKLDVRRDIGQKITDGTVSLNDIPHLFFYILNLFTKVAGVIGVGMLVWSGCRLVLSSVTEDKEGAKNSLAYAVVGMVITFSAWLLSGVIQIQLTSGLGAGDGYTLEESYKEALTGFEGVRSKEDENFPLEYPIHLPGAGEDRFRGDVTDLTSWMQNLAGALTALVTTVAIFFIVDNAFKMILAAGDADTLEKVKKSIRWIFGGMLLIIFSYIIVKTVISLPYSGQPLSEPESASTQL